MVHKPENLNRLTARQLKKAFPDNQYSPEGMRQFIDLVNESYKSFDEERMLNQRAVQISQKELESVNRELQIKNEFLDGFNHGLAHDVKNHTSNIIGLISMLRKYTARQNTEMVNMIIEKLDLSTSQLTSIVQGFLYLSRSENKVEGEYKLIDPNQLKESILIETQSMLLGKDVDLKFNFNIHDLLFSIHILKIIFVNLVSNSIKFSKPNETNNIVISLSNNDEALELEVRDNGIGMELNNPENKIFKLFNQTGTVQAKGHGVGLFVIKKIVERNNGKIQLESNIGKGTTIRIALPLIK
jgi:signal transduction histidine kinase